MFPKTLFGFYCQIMKQHPWYFGLIMLFGIYLTAINKIFTPIVSKMMVQMFEFANADNMNGIIYILAIIAGIEISMRLVSWTDDYIRSHYSPMIMRDVEIAVLKRIYKNDSSFFIDTMSGEIMSKSRVISGGIFDIVRDPIVKLLGLSVGFVVMLEMLLRQNGIYQKLWKIQKE